MARFKRLTEADLSTLTREQLLDRFEREGEYWDRKFTRGLSAADNEAYQEFSRLLHLAIDPAKAMDDLTDYLNGGTKPEYWQRKPQGASVTEPAEVVAAELADCVLCGTPSKTWEIRQGLLLCEPCVYEEGQPWCVECGSTQGPWTVVNRCPRCGVCERKAHVHPDEECR